MVNNLTNIKRMDNYFSHQTIENKTTTTYGGGNSIISLRQAHMCSV